jgi:hypothetical protein
VTGRQGRKRRKLLDDLKERRWYSHLKEDVLDRTLWRARFGRDFGPVVRQTTKWMKRSIKMNGCGTRSEWHWRGKTEPYRDKDTRVPELLCLPQLRGELAWDWSQDSAVWTRPKVWQERRINGEGWWWKAWEINLSLLRRETAILLFEVSHVMPSRPSAKGRMETR